MKKPYLKLTLVLISLIVFSSTSAQKVYKVKQMEIYKSNELVNEGKPDGTEIIIDEVAQKITINHIKDKPQIFQIVKKEKVENFVYGFGCKFKNNNGIVAMTCFWDSFYQTFTFLSFEDMNDKAGNYLKYYY